MRDQPHHLRRFLRNLQENNVAQLAMRWRRRQKFMLVSKRKQSILLDMTPIRRVSHVVCKHLNNFKTFSLLCRIEYITNNGQGRKKKGLGVKIDKRRRHCTNKSRGRFTCCNIPRNFPGFCDDRELSEAFGSMGVEYFNNSVVTPFGVQRTCCIG